MCRKIGCPELIDNPGYCPNHAHIEHNRFSSLNKADGSKAFYGGAKWKKTRAAFRAANPLCAACKRENIVAKGNLVDHIKERNDIIADGGDPYDWQYLETLCFKHHNRKLRERR